MPYPSPPRNDLMVLDETFSNLFFGQHLHHLYDNSLALSTLLELQHVRAYVDVFDLVSHVTVLKDWWVQ